MTPAPPPRSTASYDRFLNSTSSKRELSALRNIWSIQNKAGPKLVSLGTGTPNPACFPFESITVRTKDGRTIELADQALDVALGYTTSAGYPPLMSWLDEFQRRLHDPPYARETPELNQLIAIPGSEDGQCKILEMVVERGDPVLITEPTYPGMLSALKPLGAKMIAVEMDEHGIRPECLERILKQFDSKDEEVGRTNSHDHTGDRTTVETNGHSVSNGHPITNGFHDDDPPVATRRRPKIFLTQPNHVNPTGVSTTLERRKAIYRLACQYDLLLVEDDPYYFLTFDQSSTPPPSFLSLDTEGRVLRLDSFSKVVSAGLRLATLSGPRPLVERVLMHLDCSTLHANTLSQSILHRLLLGFGQDGYLEHCRTVASFYEERCRMMLTSADRYLKGLAEWNRPTGGMFLWIRILGIRDTKRMVEEKALKKMVMVTPGCFFMADEKVPTSFVRASFSWASEAEMNEGFKRLAEMIKEERERA